MTTGEVTNDRGDLLNVSFEREVARIVKMHFGYRRRDSGSLA
jgi:hypothetical protein